MPFKPGNKLSGSRKGRPNKTTQAAREVALAFLNRRTAEELDQLWEAAKGESAGKALSTWLTALEFVMPKLGRQVIVGEEGAAAIQVIINKAGPKSEGG